MDQKHRICIITTVHDYNDNRIFHKQAKSLVNSDYNVTIIAPGTEDKIEDGIEILSILKKTNRSFRMILSGLEAYRKAVLSNCHIYHFHDPEFIPYGLFLKLRKKKVIYDVHEDVPAQILSKNWIWKPLRQMISRMVNIFEKWSANYFDAIISATPSISNRFNPNNKRIVIQNYPIINVNLDSADDDYRNRSCNMAYIGSITVIRGIKEMIEAFGLIPDQYQGWLLLAGRFEPPSLQAEIKSNRNWEKVSFLGWLDRDQAFEVLDNSRAGLVLFHPVPNHLEAQPNKLFEYMAAGIPVIASNFPLWKEVIDGNQCGLTVDPFDIEAIADTIKYIFDHPGEAEEMGKRGKKAVSGKYNWSEEEKKLLKLYSSIVK